MVTLETFLAAAVLVNRRPFRPPLQVNVSSAIWQSNDLVRRCWTSLWHLSPPPQNCKPSMISHRSCWPTQLPIRFSQVELAEVLRGQARRTTVPGPVFLPDEGDAARGLQCVDREAAIAYTAAPAGGM
jgi:hypothetical protein